MKTFLLKCAVTVLISGLIFSSCKKGSQSLESNGVITKNPVILYTCNGCFGDLYFIKFANDTTLYNIDNNLAPFGITPGIKFPVKVSVNWKRDTVGKKNVIITALKLDN